MDFRECHVEQPDEPNRAKTQSDRPSLKLSERVVTFWEWADVGLEVITSRPSVIDSSAKQPIARLSCGCICGYRLEAARAHLDGNLHARIRCAKG
jgi:hypothetical protein